MSSLPLGICCNRIESLSSVSLQSLSTRHSFLGFFSKVHSPQSSMVVQLTTAGTLTLAVHVAFRLARESVAVPVTVMVLPASALVAVTVAEVSVPLPLSVPPLFDQLYVIGHPCGSVAVMVTVADSPMAIVVGLTEQLTTGACGCLMVKLAAHVAEFIFLILGSVIEELAE